MLLLAALIAATLFPDARRALFGDMRPGGLPVPSGLARVGGPFRLTAHDGRVVTDADFRGRILIVQFGYVGCGVTCRAGLQLIDEVMAQLGPSRAAIAPVFITLAPDRDTPAALRAFLERDHPGIIGLTGKPAVIEAVAKSYFVNPRRLTDTDPKGRFRIEHQSLIYVMGRDGRYVGHFSFATPPRDIIAKLKRLL
ncbi:MAG: SCO family protein [Hyphomicrobiaceae bacterium]|nr:SCO family protein [Hyphomicrobiaceae bacterium]